MIMDAQPAAAACASKKVAMSAALLVAGVVAISVGVAQMSTSSAATGESNLRSGFELSGDSLDALREACDFGEERFCWQYTDRADCPRDDDKGCKWVTDSETDTSSCEPKNACVCFEMPVNTCEAKSDEETCTQFDACTWSGGACSTKPGCVDFQGSTPTPAPTSLADLCVFGASVNKYCWMHDTSEICLSKTGCEWLNDEDGCTSIDECVCYDSPQAGCVQKGDEEKCMQFRGCDWVDGACASIADCDSGSQGGGGGDGEPPVAEECDFGEDVQFCHQHNTASKCRTPDGCKWMQTEGEVDYCTSINSCVCEDLPINGCDAKDEENCGKFRGCIWEGDSCARVSECSTSAAPSSSPTAAPTVEDALPNPPSPPSSSPSTSPSTSPTSAPSGAPTGAPTAAPSIWPTLSPSASPTITDIQPQPPMSPTASPSASPTGAPSVSKPGWG